MIKGQLKPLQFLNMDQVVPQEYFIRAKGDRS